MAVYHGTSGKITVSGTVVGGCSSAEITVEREIAEFGAIGATTKEIAAGQRTVSFSLADAWAGSRWLPILGGTGSNWDIIVEVTGGAVIIASGCLAGGTSWTMNATEINASTLTGRAGNVYASGVSLN